MSNVKYNYVIAEDESLIRRNLVKKLEALDLPLQKAGEAANGEEAIGLIEKYCPQLVITDIRMPLRDGLEVVKYLYDNHPGTKVIILSGYDDFSYAQKAIRYSVEDYLLKPVSRDTLSESIRKILIKLENESGRLSIYNTKNTSLSPEALSQLVQQYLLENYQQEISFQELGEKFGFTPEYLGKIFLIHEPDIEIQKIGDLVGYKDGFYFSRVFKSYTGMQPSEFRSRNAPGQSEARG